MSIRGRKIFILSDSHFFHKRVCEFSNRPKNFAEKLKKNWQQLVKPKDTVIHLGDVIFGNKEQLTDILKDLPGQKILIRGNHDKGHSDNWFIDAGFSFVCQVIVIKDIILSHRPFSLISQDLFSNIHGHFHNIPQKQWEKNLVDRLTEKHYLFSLEMVDYKPILLDEAIPKGLVVLSKNVK